MSNYVLEWSRKQNAFHIQEAALMVNKNLSAMIDDRASDYIVLGIGPRAEIDKLADKYRHYLARREAEKILGMSPNTH